MLRPTRGRRILRRFTADRRGVSAVEFAFIAPILILMFIGMADLSTALMAQRRASHSTSSTGDLVAQFATMDPTSDMPSVFEAANDVMAPYSTATYQVRVSSLIVDGSAQLAVRVNWSCAPTTNNAAYGARLAGTIVTLPSGIVSNTGDSVVMVESTYVFTPPATWQNMAFGNGFNFNNVFYFRPRQTTQVSLTFPSSQSPAYSSTPWVSTSQSNPYSYTSSTAGVPSLNCFYQSG